MDFAPVLAVAAALAIGGVIYLAHRYGRLGWALAGLGAIGAVALAVLSRKRLAASAPPPPPPTRGVERVRRTAGDILTERQAEADARVTAALTAAEREEEIARLVDARKRRP